MKPLPWIAMGLLIVALSARVDGFDLLADPVGWLLVLYGVDRHGRLTWSAAVVRLAVLALVVSCVLWFPGTTDALADADPALVWAASVPQLAVVGTLCAGFARVAAEAGDRRARSWLRTAATLAVVTTLVPLPVLAADGDVDAVLPLGLATMVLAIVLLFRYAARPWALAPVDQTTATGPPATA